MYRGKRLAVWCHLPSDIIQGKTRDIAISVEDCLEYLETSEVAFREFERVDGKPSEGSKELIVHGLCCEYEVLKMKCAKLGERVEDALLDSLHKSALQMMGPVISRLEQFRADPEGTNTCCKMRAILYEVVAGIYILRMPQ